jgi:hypothetical protein
MIYVMVDVSVIKKYNVAQDQKEITELLNST